MILYNINNPSERAGLKDAVMKGQPRTPGLYMPASIPSMPRSFFSRLGSLSLPEIGFEVSRNMIGDEIPESIIGDIVFKSLDFPVPLVKLENNLYVLELFHGPTLAFKDVGARFMASLFDYYLRNEDRDTTVLVATSGDTGSAVANAFNNREGIRVVILYPKGGVSHIQQKMLTTNGDNVTAIEIEGDFDSCQKLVKMAFNDVELSAERNLTSANSINFGRLFPQAFYYFHAIGQLGHNRDKVAISVPCGNFGNLTAGIMAGKMGLPVSKFIASNNENHAVADYLSTGVYAPAATKHTLSNAMDVGDPGNFPRLQELFSGDLNEFRNAINGYWFSDDRTLEAMEELYARYGYVTDPHGAVAYLGLNEYLKGNAVAGIFLGTAHPVKFMMEASASKSNRVRIPGQVSSLMHLPEKKINMPDSFVMLKEFLMQSF